MGELEHVDVTSLSLSSVRRRMRVWEQRLSEALRMLKRFLLGSSVRVDAGAGSRQS